MKGKILPIMVIGIILYLIPWAVTLCIRKNIPEEKGETFDSGIRVYLSNGDQVNSMDLDEYLVGVVAAQIPGDSPLEALKAQSVIARTYAMNTIGERKSVEATELSLPYYSDGVLRSEYGENYSAYHGAICQAVNGTTEEILTYEGSAVIPVFFKCGSGKTRDAGEVWGSSIPYLVSVDSAWDTDCETCPQEIVMDVEKCIDLLKGGVKDFQASPETFKDTVQILERDGSGYVTRIQMGNCEFTGEEARTALNLPSSNFEVRAKSKTITFNVTGIGHGVGLSQWGACAMAKEGQGYEQILSWYFPGTAIDT